MYDAADHAPEFVPVDLAVVMRLARLVPLQVGVGQREPDRLRLRQPPNRTARSTEEALPVLGILTGVGAFIQVMTLTGARGFVVEQVLPIPRAGLEASMAA